jgi:hypothetical protein
VIGQLQGCAAVRVVKRGGTIVRSESELDLVSPSLIVHGIFPVFKFGESLIMSEWTKRRRGTDTL